MGRRPAKCYRRLSTKAFVKSRFARGGPESKISIHDLGNKKAPAEALPARINLISLESENIASEALESLRIACNKYMLKNVGKDNYHLRVCPHAMHILRINKMLSCAGADRLQTGMRGSYGKPYGMAARVFIGDHLVNIRTKEQFVAVAQEALRRGKNKLPGKQLIQVSGVHGFTGLSKEEFVRLRGQRRLLPVGNSVAVIRESGSISTFVDKVSRAL